MEMQNGVVDNPISRRDAEIHAAKHGIALNKMDLQRIHILEQTAIEQVSHTEHKSWVDGITHNYLKLLQAIEGVSNILFTMMRAVIVSFGVPVILILLLFVEQQRVTHGIQLFENNIRLAAFGAWALVLLNLVLEFTIEYVEGRHGYKHEANTRFSLRVWGQKIQYMVGLTSDWRPQTLSPAHRYKQLLRVVTFTILMLALAGSMKDIITLADEAWYNALHSIVAESNLQLMVTWLGGLLFAAAAVLSAQGLSRYIAVRCVEIIDVMNQTPTDNDEMQSIRDAAASQYILAKVSENLAKKNSQSS